MACKLRLDNHPNQKARRRLATVSTAVITLSRREDMRQIASGALSVLEKCRMLREVEGVSPQAREAS